MFTNNVGGGTGDSIERTDGAIERTDDAIERYVTMYLSGLDPAWQARAGTLPWPGTAGESLPDTVKLKQ